MEAERAPAKKEAVASMPVTRLQDEATYARARRNFVLAAAATAVGLAVAGTLDTMTGGVIVLLAWLGGIAALHRLGRAGSVS